jgi:hypothetical protein
MTKGLSMSARANAFYSRLIKVDWHKGHIYNTTTKARVMQAKFFLDCLTGEATLEAPEYLDEFDRRDMLLFGLVNSLRSSLDSFTHELVLYYRGSAKRRRDVQFSNLLTRVITISLPPALRGHIEIFQAGATFEYLKKLRNSQQHRCYALMRTQTSAPASLTIVGADSEVKPADWWGGEPPTQGRQELGAAKSQPEPDSSPEMRRTCREGRSSA